MGWLARQHAMQHRPQRVDVPPRVGRFGQVGLFRGHVEERAQRGRLVVGQPRLAEVGQPGLAVGVQQDVGRFQVAMQNALVVGVDQSDGHVAKYLDRTGRRQGTLLEPVGQRSLIEILHDVVGRLGVPTNAEQLDHVAIGEQEGELLDLAGKERPIETPSMGIEFDRHPTTRVPLAGHPDLAVGPHAEVFFGFVARHVQRGSFPLHADFLRTAPLGSALGFGCVGAHARQYNKPNESA